jgi:hypothetical protein
MNTGWKSMKKNIQKIKTFCLRFPVVLLFFVEAAGVTPANAQANKAVFEKQTSNTNMPVSNSTNVGMQKNLVPLLKDTIQQPQNTAQEQDCSPNDGSMWVNGPFKPDIAIEAQQKLGQLGINSIVEARSYGEDNNCGTYTHHGMDFKVKLLTTEISAQSVGKETIDNIRATLAALGKPSLGKVSLIDFQGNEILLPTYSVPKKLQALDANQLPPDAIYKKVYVIVYDPLLQNGQKLSEYKHWSDYSLLTQKTIDFFKQASSNKLNYTIVETTIITAGWPALTDGFSYTESDYLAVLAGQQTPHSPNGVDYNKIVNSTEFDICGKANRGEIDEVWIYNGPWFGFYESTLVGPGAYFLNSNPVSGSHGCNKIVPIMGPSVERQIDEAVHNFTHRTESTMKKVYGSWSENNTSHNWNKFALVKAQSPNYPYSGCGSSHYPPNGTADYDYANTSTISSNCDDFFNYPNLSDPLQVLQPVTCSIWGCTGIGYYNYWYNHFPSGTGCGPDNVANNWWNYIANPAIALYPQNACQVNMHIISGNAGIGNVTLSYTDGIQKTVTSDSYGNYFLMVSDQWSGLITPSKDGGYTFSPATKNYMNIQSDSYNQNYTAALNGPEIIIKGNNYAILDGDNTPSSYDYTDFGTVAVANGTTSHTFTIYNTGAGNLNLTGTPKVTINGAQAGDFSLIGQPANQIAPSGSTTFTIVFDPSSGGIRTASISIANDDSNENPYDFSIQGIGDIYPEMDIKGNGVSIIDGSSSPTTANYTNFGSAAVANGSISRTFAIYNTGAGNLNLTGTPKVTISGAQAGDFSIVVQPASPIIPSDSTTFTVVFDPSASGVRNALISIANDDSNENPYDFSIQGTGTTSPEIEIKGNDISILDGDTTPSQADFTDFGSTDIVGGSVSRTFTIYNLGDGNLTLTGSPNKVYVFGTNSSDFTVTAQPTTPIVPGGSTTFNVAFDPSAAGLRTATLNIYSDDSNENPYNFAIQGTGMDYSKKDITAFNFTNPAATGSISGTNINVTVSFGTNVTSLVANFTTTGASVKVGSTTQVNGVTANNFTNPVTYTVTAADGSTKNYIVTVTVAPNPAKDITAFGFTSPAATGEINGTNIAVRVPFGTDITSLVADFTATGTSVKVGAKTQISGITVNNFTNPVTYTVTAADGSTADYIVTVMQTPPSTNANLSNLALSGINLTFTSDTTSYIVAIDNSVTGLTVTPTTADSTATITINGVTVVSGSISNSIPLAIGDNIIKIVVTAQDGTTTKAYTINVKCSPATPSVYKLFLPLLLR